MKTKKKLVDCLMSVAMLLLMSYLLIGQNLHEIIGTSLLIIVIIHNVLNRRWYKGLPKGKWTAYRSLNTAMNLLVLISLIVTIISGIAMSRFLFTWLDLPVSASLMRTLHLIFSHWSFVLMALHLGMHLSKGFASRTVEIVAGTISLWGAYLFVTRGIYAYLFNQAMFFNAVDKSLITFIPCYLAMAILFITIGKFLRKIVK